MSIVRILSLVTVAGVVHAACAQAQNAPPPGPPPAVCTNSAERHQFDFWIGEWKVTTAAGGEAGKSSVQPIAGGCALLENWTSRNGGQGKSINAYNPALKQWQQYWIGQDGNPAEYRESSWSGKTLVFVARAPGIWQRLSFTPMEDGTVRQFGEVSRDDGKTWTPTYDFRYHRM